MGLFDAIKNAVAEKECSICGGDAGRVFAKKLEDGYLCKECTDKLSPWFSDRRSSTVAQIQEQLDYREANKADVEAFQVTKTLNGNYKILIDEDKGNFVVTRASNWRAANPDGITANTSKKKIQKQQQQAADAAKAAAAKEYAAKKGIVQEQGQASAGEQPLSGIAERPNCKGRAYDPNRYGTHKTEE